MAEIIWTEPALSELDEIADYISLDNPEAAKKLVRNIFKKADRLSEHPFSGKTIPELGRSVYRELVHPPCRIFYRIDDDKVLIIYVMREEQHFKADRLIGKLP